MSDDLKRRRSRNRKLVLPEDAALILRTLNEQIIHYCGHEKSRDTVDFAQYAAALWLQGWSSTCLAEVVGKGRQGVHRHIKEYLDTHGGVAEALPGYPLPTPPGLPYDSYPSRARR